MYGTQIQIKQVDINSHSFQINKTVRYSTYGELTEKTKYFWMALHGSRMICEQVLYKFSEFDPSEHFVVAPEAFNRFYAKDFGGDVVASWMTKRDRLHEINDICNYLTSLYQHLDAKIPDTCHRVLLGFSQGGTTGFRWLNEHSVNFHSYLAYSCWIPEEVELTNPMTSWSELQLIYTYGLQDQFLKPETIEKLEIVVHKNNLPIIKDPYEGDHRIDRDNLKRLFQKYIFKKNHAQGK